MRYFALICALGLLPAASRSTPAWHRIKTVHQPSQRLGMSTAYDPISRRLVLFGGYDGAAYFADTWVFDGKDWSMLRPASAPPVRTGAGLAYDAVSHKLVLFGGYDGNAWLGDTWLYDGATGAWQQAHPIHQPPAGTGVAVFSDPQSGHAMVYGGFDGSKTIGYSNQTFRWTGSDWRQLQVTAPSARSSAGYAKDPATHSVVLFGGLGSVNPYSTWLWQNNDWAEQNPAQMPPERFSMGIACDTGLAGCILFGGDQGGLSLGDAWMWSGATAQWQALQPSGSPGPRELFAMQYDPALRKIIIFGGLRSERNKQRLLNDTWSLH